jgi:hypothetical protein
MLPTRLLPSADCFPRGTPNFQDKRSRDFCVIDSAISAGTDWLHLIDQPRALWPRPSAVLHRLIPKKLSEFHLTNSSPEVFAELFGQA